MPHVILCRDRPGALAIRQANRAAHLAHIEAAGGAISLAGPLLDDAGEMCGSLLVHESDDRAEVDAWVEADPYGRAGLFAEVEIRRWKRVVG